MDKILRVILDRIRMIEIEMFKSPPKTMEDFRERFGRYQELKTLSDNLIEEAKGLEKD